MWVRALIVVISCFGAAGIGGWFVSEASMQEPSAEDASPAGIEIRRHPERGSAALGTLLEEYTVLIEDGEEFKHGRYRKWNDKPYLLIEDCWYYRGKKHGPAMRWEFDVVGERGGVVVSGPSTRRISEYIDGLEHGLAKGFYSDGSRKWESSYQLGQAQGAVRSWHPNGVLAHENRFVAGKLEGVARAWWDNGQSHAEYGYASGVKHGTCKEWHKNGQIKAEITYKHGKKDGVAKEWNAEGELVHVKTYRDGKLVEDPADK